MVGRYRHAGGYDRVRRGDRRSRRWRVARTCDGMRLGSQSRWWSNGTIRAERKLGQILAQAKESGHIKEGKPKKDTVPEENSIVRLSDIGIDRKESRRAQQIANL